MKTGKVKIRQTTVILLLFLISVVAAVFTLPDNTTDTYIRSIGELSGKNVGVQNSTMYEVSLMKKNPDALVSIYSDPSSMEMSLIQRKIDAIATEEITYRAMKIAHPEVVALDEPLDTSPVGFAFAENERGRTLYYQMEEYIAKCNSNGTLKKLEEYWVKKYDPDTSRSRAEGFTGKNGTIRIAMEAGFEGFSNLVDGKPCGLDVDYVYGFCREYDYIPEIILMDFDGIAPSITSGKCDFGSGIVLTEEREEELLVSSCYYENKILMVAIGESESGSFIDEIKNSFVNTFIKENRWKMFLEGTGVTLLITIMSVLIGTLLGFGGYLLIKDGDPFCGKFLGAFSWIVQGVPTVVILMLLYYVIFGTKSISSTITAIIGFSIMFACSVMDMIGSGVKAVDSGQNEAARAQGLSNRQSFFRIILPQAAYHFMPSFKSEVITILQETSIVGYIAIMDLTKMADMIRSRTFDAFFPIISSAIIYLLLIVVLTKIIDRINPKIDITKRKLPKEITMIQK